MVQTVETFQNGGVPAFVETLDAVQVGKQAGMPIAPIMIYGDDVSHVVTEEGIAYLYKAEGQEERRRALAAVAGVSPVGLKAVAAETDALRKREWWRTRRTSVFIACKRSALCWPRAVCRIWSPGPGDFTARRLAFGVGSHEPLLSNAASRTLWALYQ